MSTECDRTDCILAFNSATQLAVGYCKEKEELQKRFDSIMLAQKRIDEWMEVSLLPEDHPIRLMQKAVRGD